MIEAKWGDGPDAGDPLPESPFDIPIEGEGTGQDQQDVFVQTAMYGMVDILWVVDNSQSMTDNQTNIAANFQRFINVATQFDSDFHIGVITTDVIASSDKGKLQGSPLYIDTSTPDPVGTFQSNVMVGANGSAAEAGLYASQLAFSDPAAVAHNAGFLRNDARLAIIYVSDEQDNSECQRGMGLCDEDTGDGYKTVATYVNYLKNLKHFVPGQLVMSAFVVTDLADCPQGQWKQFVGTRYIEAAQLTNGVVESICEPDWGQALENLGLNAFGLPDTFYLSMEPGAGTITVFIEPQDPNDPRGARFEVPESTTDGYKYWPGPPSVRFYGSMIPKAGDKIEVNYKACP